MKIATTMNHEAILRELGARLARVRLERNLTQAALAEEAGVAKRTVERLESGEVATQLLGLIRVCRALGLLERLDALIPEGTVSPIAQLERQGRRRQRASGSRAASGKTRKWAWGDES